MPKRFIPKPRGKPAPSFKPAISHQLGGGGMPPQSHRIPKPQPTGGTRAPGGGFVGHPVPKPNGGSRKPLVAAQAYQPQGGGRPLAISRPRGSSLRRRRGGFV